MEDTAAIVLILGSMPGKASLAAGEYYAHPRNLFWPIMGELVGAHPGLPYEGRLRMLKSSGIALWDVLESCIRNSSLDSHIEEASVIPNDFDSFFQRHPNIAMFSSTASRLNSAFGGMYSLRSNPDRCNIAGCHPRARQMQERHTR